MATLDIPIVTTAMEVFIAGPKGLVTATGNSKQRLRVYDKSTSLNIATPDTDLKTIITHNSKSKILT